jgi:hypothetical protein
MSILGESRETGKLSCGRGEREVPGLTYPGSLGLMSKVLDFISSRMSSTAA